jgi:glyoxalase superfamily protein
LDSGAIVLGDQPPGVGWIVLAGPEGNEFCLQG